MLRGGGSPEADSTKMTGTAIHFESQGQGLGLVFTHGFGDDSTTWSPLWPALARCHRVLRWDLLGHGRGTHPALDRPWVPRSEGARTLEPRREARGRAHGVTAEGGSNGSAAR